MSVLSHLYGIISTPVKHEAFILEPSKCRKLVTTKILDIEGNQIEVDNVSAFHADFTLYNSVRGENGYCKNGSPFKLKGVDYPNNWAVAQITGRVYKKMVKFDPNYKLLDIDGTIVPMDQMSHSNDHFSYIWNTKSYTCTTLLKEIYIGEATFLSPKSAQFRQQIMVRDHVLGSTFALDLREESSKCGTNVRKTQMPNIYVIMRKKSFINGLQKTKDVDRVDSMLGLLR